MAITIKDQEGALKMREAGRIVAEVLEAMKELVRPGVSTKELDQAAEEIIRSHHAIPSFKGYSGFPASICASIDEEVIHGIPSKQRILKEGQIISIDVGAYKDGYHGDACRTYGVGAISEEDQRLIKAAENGFFAGCRLLKSGAYLYDISKAIQRSVEREGFSVVRDYVGHGIGKAMHEEPMIPNYKPFGFQRGVRLQKGMALAIEPMITAGSYKVSVLSDGWTVVTKDKSKAAHYENSVLITEDGYEILTIL